MPPAAPPAVLSRRCVVGYEVGYGMEMRVECWVVWTVVTEHAALLAVELEQIGRVLRCGPARSETIPGETLWLPGD